MICIPTCPDCGKPLLSLIRVTEGWPLEYERQETQAADLEGNPVPGIVYQYMPVEIEQPPAERREFISATGAGVGVGGGKATTGVFLCMDCRKNPEGIALTVAPTWKEKP